MKVHFRKRFKKSYNRCTPKVREQFKKRLKLFLEDPFHPLLENHALHGEWQPLRSINITGDYRALYQQIEETIEFVLIDTHSNLYE